MTPPRPARPGPSPSPRVCVFGEALVDELPGGEVPGGAPLNVACHAAGFGLAPLLVTRVGRDEAGATLLAAHVVKVSDEELEEVRRLLCLTLRDPEALSADVVRRFRLRALYVTRGAKGAFVAARTGGDAVTFAEVPAAEPPGPVVDTGGAGDAFTSVVLLGLVKGWTAEESLRHGVDFAGTVTRMAGATPGDPAFYAPFHSAWERLTP